MPLIVIFLCTLFLAAMNQLATARDADRQDASATTRHNRTITVAQLVNRYMDETGGTPPVSLAALAATPGYAEAHQYVSGTEQGDGPFLVTYALNDGINNYKRVIVYSTPLDGSISPADYLTAANNACGATAASAAGAWCGNPTGSYWTVDTRSRMSLELARERTQQQLTLAKFAQAYWHYQINGAFPDPGGGNGSAATLISKLTGYTLTAATCTGVWVWATVPLTCDDLYSVWGTPRVYNYINNEFISLYVESPWNEGSGPTVPIVVASALNTR